MKGKLEIYQGRNHKWRWRITHKNGQITQGATQGYSRRIDVVRNLLALSSILRHVPFVTISDLPKTGPATWTI